MKKTKLITIIITGALAAVMTATVFAAQSGTAFSDNTAQIPALNNSDSLIARPDADESVPELPELPKFEDETDRPELPGAENDADRPELPGSGDDTDRPELPNGTIKSFMNEKGVFPPLFISPENAQSQYIPKLKPETKPEDEDITPPEFEGVENIETLGRPELPEGAEGMPGESAPGESEGNEAPQGMNEAPGESAPGESEGNEAPQGMNEAPGESAPGESEGNEAPQGMNERPR